MTKWLHFHFSLSFIGEGNGNPLQCSCLENPRDGGAWLATVYRVTQSRTRLKWLGSSVWMGELDHKESWAPKNWCFRTVVLEKTPQSPLDSKEIKPVNLKGNQPWILIGRTDAEAEAPVFWSPDSNSWLIGKVPDAGKDWEQREKRVRGCEGWMASLMQRTWSWANFRRWWGTGMPGVLLSMELQRVGHDWATEQ